jgi:uncharacterized damage-inducible protein DinB
VLASWGPGKFDAQLFLDGKAFRPDGKTAATLLSAAFGLAGVNLHTYTGWGGVPHWNAFVANLEMHGQGTFIDSRLNDAARFPVAARAGFAEVRSDPDLTTSKLPALQFYQLSLAAPKPPRGSFDAAAARAGKDVFNGAARCATCHVPPIFTEPGWNMHTAAEIGIDDFQSTRSPDERYRTTPLGGLFTRQKGGFYHDGRFPDLRGGSRPLQQLFQPESQRTPEARAHRIPQVAVISTPQSAGAGRGLEWTSGSNGGPMKLTEHLLAELDREAPRTRRTLEKVPTGRDDWTPHPKSMPLARLAGLVASMPSWITLIIEQDELNLTPPPGAGQYQQPAMDKLADVHDANVAKGRASLSKTNDDYLMSTNWRLIAGGQVVMEQPRHVVLRETMMHLAHHRGQLTVYLRLCDQPVPSIYGPTADDKTFG